MSKASDFARARALNGMPARLEFIASCAQGQVTDSGGFHLSTPFLVPSDALALGIWLMDTFGDVGVNKGAEGDASDAAVFAVLQRGQRRAALQDTVALLRERFVITERK